MSDSLLDEVFVMTVGSARLNQMHLNPDLWFLGEHDVHVCARNIADMLVWHEKYPGDTRVSNWDCRAALCFLSHLEARYATSAIMYVYNSCASDGDVAGNVFSMIVDYCKSR